MRRGLLSGLWALAVVIAATPAVSFGCPDGYYNTAFGVCLPNSGTVAKAPIEIPKTIGTTVINGVQNDPVRLLVNPLSYINKSGVPAPGDFVEFAIKNPDKVIDLVQNPGQWPYIPVAQATIAGHNAAVNAGAQPIPPDIRQFLLRWYPADLLAGVRWTSSWNAVQNSLQAAQMNIGGQTQAITLINAVVFRNSAAVSDKALWAHELLHVSQYRSWGVFGFAKKWVDNSSTGGPVEAPAYAREDEARAVLAQQGGSSNSFAGNPSVPVPAPSQTGGQLSPPMAMPVGLPSGTQLSACGCATVAWGTSGPAPQCSLT